ncbi:MAG: phosphonopyruvate decarboxylase [Desulfurococcales archaeon ex4484_204]|nr:MAG: phosphonopyruvate decarboxylase [Desulfurococcales archaeon ex4484_204]
MVKLLYLVLDGVADRLADPATTLEKAFKPGLDYVASNGVCGAMYVIGKGVAPESDSAVISILGYDPRDVYTGRGPIEALGAGMVFKEGVEVAFRANFATVDAGTLRILDRRVGRSLTSEEGRALARAIDGIDLGVHDGYARVKATVGHRAVVVIGSRRYRLSPMVSNSDPAYERRGLISVASKLYRPYIRDVEPLEDSEEARVTAEIVNAFIRKAVEVLSGHPVNAGRVGRGLPPANALLLRDAGTYIPRAKPLNSKYGAKFALLAEMPVELGIGRAFKADVVEIPLPSDNPREDYRLRLEKTLEALGTHDIVYVHLKGPDEPGHDGDQELKRRRVEEIDEYFVQPFLKLMPRDVALLVTADHATPPSVRAHTDDPVPIALLSRNLKPDPVGRFTERDCARGVLGVLEHGWVLLPKVLSLIGMKPKAR